MAHWQILCLQLVASLCVDIQVYLFEGTAETVIKAADNHLPGPAARIVHLMSCTVHLKGLGLQLHFLPNV